MAVGFVLIASRLHPIFPCTETSGAEFGQINPYPPAAPRALREKLIWMQLLLHCTVSVQWLFSEMQEHRNHAPHSIPIETNRVVSTDFDDFRIRPYTKTKSKNSLSPKERG